MMGKQALYFAMLRRFVASQKGLAGSVNDALASGDLAGAERLAHTARSVAGNIGATEVQRLAGAVETAIREMQPPLDVQKRLAQLERSLETLVAALEERLGAAPELAQAA
jgi:HPt (histidine-containing phosphotransfer) domain-containing protein